jgi:ABC-type uncharacterized transport system permease subunit
MTNSDIKLYIHEQHTKGTSKSDIYNSLLDQEVPAKKAAMFIAQFCDPSLRQQHSGKINLILVLLVLQLILGLWVGFEMAAVRDIPIFIPIVFVGFFAGMMLWGVWTDKGPMYNSIMMLTAVGMIQTLPALGSDPIALFGFIVPIGFIALVYNTRSLVFPHLGLFGPKKENGQYTFL